MEAQVFISNAIMVCMIGTCLPFSPSAPSYGYTGVNGLMEGVSLIACSTDT